MVEAKKKEKRYRVSFLSKGTVYEIYAKFVAQSNMLGFIEVEGLIFGDPTSVVVDPSEERLRNEFQGVRRCYIPIQAIIRIDEVEKEGPAKILELKGRGENISPFPGVYYPTTRSED